MNTFAARLGLRPTSIAAAFFPASRCGYGNISRRYTATLQPRIHSYIPKTRKDGVEYAARISKLSKNAGLCVFTDGSRSTCSGGGAGGAARARTPSGTTIVMKQYLGVAEEYHSLEAEILGITLGVRIANTANPGPSLTRLTILTDCQPAIHALLSLRAKAKYAPLIRRFHDEVRRSPNLLQIRLVWVPGHQGVEMNVLVNEDAREAARSGDSGTILIDSGGSRLCLPPSSTICDASL
ncbi:hypothetical protein MVEN_01497600 [Mycena venus]|uniref:RNase H type-1 domain-containing protein n=1 Tax=Mycena venus TaxID=2733690 RepID=A0A8H6XUG8_9AGAR|nr:hypothetical protein MVEN_01497600 [Mycena venus]